MARGCFPFAAVIGQARVKEALLLNAVNPRVGGVLISGEKGTAKSTLVRGLADVLDGIGVVDLPLNVTEDRLVGSIDIEAAIARGKKTLEPGILQQADGNILYVDEVNLLSEHIANCLLEAAASGVNVVEREGISCRHAARFVLVGTMNPEEGLLRPQLVDRFGLYTEVHGEADPKQRAEIIRRRLAYERDPAAYIEQWREASRALAARIKEAQERLPRVEATEANLSLAAAIASEGGCAGHRAEIIIIEAARAIAALGGRTEILAEDIQKAAGYALPHRLREPAPVYEESNGTPPQAKNDAAPAEGGGAPPHGAENEAYDLPAPAAADMPAAGEPERERREDPAGAYDLEIAELRLNGFVRPRGTGKRTRVKADFRQGRYVKYRLPAGRLKELALDATLRAAAPFQNVRKEPGLAVVIRPPDIREKVKEKHTGCVVLFVVDASGSMGARRRMAAVKGAVLSLLGDVYRKRDRVGVIAFRQNGAATLLGVTRSVDLAHRCLRELPTGGRTPLAAGLEKAWELLKTTGIKEPDMLPYLVLVSDGKANAAVNGGNPLAEALRMAGRIKQAGINCMVLDTEDGYVRLGLAGRIAEALGARYVRLDDVSAAGIRASVRQLVA